MKPAKTNLLSLLLIFFLLMMSRFAAALEVGQKAPDFELESTKGGKLALSSKSQRPEERQRLRAIAQEMASQVDCQVEVDDEPGEYTVWLYGPRRAIGAIMRELAPRQ